MRIARTVLLICMVVGLAAIAAAARGHLRELRDSFRDAEERSVAADLRKRVREVAPQLRDRLAAAPVVAEYDAAGRLVRPAPPARARAWSPPVDSLSADLTRRGEYERALERATTSADRAAAYVRLGARERDAALLRKALAEPALRGTDLYYRVGLEVFSLEKRKPDLAWRDEVSALLGGPSAGFARLLLDQAGVEPVGDIATRQRLAQLRPEGYFAANGDLYFAESRVDGTRLHALAIDSLDTGRGPIEMALEEPFEAVVLRAAPDPAAVQRAFAGAQQRLLFFYALAGLFLLGGTAYAYIAIGRTFRLAAAKNDFVANVTHELKTPLANIRLYAETLAAGRARSQADRAEFLRTILDEAGRLDTLVDGLLHAARGARKLRLESVEARWLLDEVERRWRKRLEGEGFEFKVVAPDDLPALRGDREALLRALSNLIDNARKYGGAEKRVRVEAERVGDGVQFTVYDRGPGIPVRARARVLRKFTRIESADRKETAGTGLGLSLVKACIEAHGGRIRIGDGPDRGTAVSLVLPTTEEPA
jgi:two-component system phosphate regulon sensor histidine kinase PhoR